MTYFTIYKMFLFWICPWWEILRIVSKLLFPFLGFHCIQVAYWSIILSRRRTNTLQILLLFYWYNNVFNASVQSVLHTHAHHTNLRGFPANVANCTGMLRNVLVRMPHCCYVLLLGLLLQCQYIVLYPMIQYLKLIKYKSFSKDMINNFSVLFSLFIIHIGF